MDFADKKVLVMGLGLHGGGLGVVKFLAQNKARITVTDLKTEKDLTPTLKQLENLSVKYVLGKHNEEDFKNQDLIIRNPAVPLDSPYLQIAQKEGTPIEMESSIFFLSCPSKNIIGITGTKGKTTTTLMITQLLKDAGFKVVVGGNLRISMLELLPKIDKDTFVVLELSSWQLEGLLPHKISPHIALITNISRDHLNRYKDMEDYQKTKKIIFQFQKPQDWLIINENLKNLASSANSQTVFFSKSEVRDWQLIVKGEHNRENSAAAKRVGEILKIPAPAIKKSLTLFRGVEHRLEFIKNIEGVDYYNDTCATSPSAAIANVKVFDNPVVLIAGGADKNLDFSEFTRLVNQKVKKIILLEGTATDKIAQNLDKKLIAGRFNDFKKAVLAAKNSASPGDIILLSPACASFGMFQNEFDRGTQFKQIVTSLCNYQKI